MGSKSPHGILMMLSLVCAVLPAAIVGAAVLPPPAIAQSSSLAQDIIDAAQLEADSSASGSNLDNNNEFGDDNIPIIDQDNTAEQDAANLGLQDQDAAQDQDAIQEDFDVQVGEAVQQQSQQQPPQTEPPPPPPPPEEEDTTPPVIIIPEDMVVEATSEQGAVVEYTATAQDDRDGTVPVECTPESGSQFPIGVTTVECTATDEAGNTATASFTVTVQDTTPLECSVEITTDKETYGPGDTVSITITNTGDVPVEFPDSFLGLEIRNVDTGEVFPLDAQPGVFTFAPGASATFEFTYEELVSEIGAGLISATVPSECTGTVEEVTFTLSEAPPEEDTTPPTLTVPEDMVVEATSAEGAEVRYTVTAQDNVDGTVPVECTPESGSTFPVGVTTVECTATDAAGNVGRASFTVTVNPVESPRENGKIAWDGYIDRNREIYVMNADGSNQQRLTNNPALDAVPDWSPDGTKIVFVRSIDGNPDIYVMNADGSNVQRLTNLGNEYWPSWSPDGTKIAFHSFRDGNAEIYVMNAADGSNVQRLTNNAADDRFPSWSPDGTKIAFASVRTGNLEIYVMNAADGSNVQRLTNNAADDYFPDWSPDGTKIAFASSGDIYVMNADGTNPTNLTNNPAADSSPSWSPDGTKIAFMSYRDGDAEIYVMNADGSGQTRLTDNPPTGNSNPDWGPAANTD